MAEQGLEDDVVSRWGQQPRTLTATRYSGATSARRNSASSRKLTSRATTAIAGEVVEHGVTVSPASAVCPPRRRRPVQPGAAQQLRHPIAQGAQVVDRGRGERVAVEDDGQPGAAAARVDQHLGRRRRLLGPPTTAATPGWRATSASRRAERGRRPRRARVMSTSVGETIPGAKPRLAASSALTHLVARGERADETQAQRSRADVDGGEDQQAMAMSAIGAPPAARRRCGRG